MRATMKIASNNAINNILDNYGRILHIQNQMATGQRLVNPSDDPLAGNDGIRMDSLLARIAQYDRNIDNGVSVLNLSDSALGEVNSILHTAKALTIGAATETTTQEMRRANALEMQAHLEELIAVANRRDGTRYIFGGTETTRPPFEIVGGRYVYYRGNEEEIRLQVDAATMMPVNVTGQTAFGTLETVIRSRDLDPDVNLNLDFSTRLEDLNLGQGVAEGYVNLVYRDFDTTGLDVDLREADTLEDVKDIIERETKKASTALGSTTYIRVDLNAAHNGLTLMEWDSGTNAPPAVAPTVALTVSEVAGNTVARNLGIEGTGAINGLVNALEGIDTDPVLSERTLLADLDGFADGAITITNGGVPGNVYIGESNDPNNIADRWQLDGLTKGETTGDNGELYARIGQPVAGTWQVEVFTTPAMAGADRVAVGTSTAATGTVVLQEDNASGVTGTVSINYLGGPTTSETLDLTAEFDPTFRATVNVPAFEESGETNDQLANWHIRGLESGVHTDADGTLYTRVTDTGPGGPYLVELFNDAARGAGDRVLSGTIETAAGEVILQGDAANGFGDAFGTVSLDYAGDQDAELTATFATLGDLMNAVKVSNTYSQIRLREDGRGIEFVSQLAGATLTVSERFVSVPVSGDDQQQLSGLSLNGVSFRSNTDIDGNLHAEVVDAGAGTSPRYQVRIYKDAARTELVASGGTDLLGAQAVQLQAENDSVLSGSVTLNFTGDDSDLVIPLWQPRIQQDNQGPGGGPQLSQLSLDDLDPGRNADPDGNLFLELLDVAGSPTVRVYKDAAHTQLVAEGSIAGPSGLVTLAEQNSSGLTGSVYVDYNADDLAITVTQPRGLRASGQEQQANIFSTFNDSIEAMIANDTDRLTNLLDNFDVDLGRILDGRAETGSRADRMQLLQVRHEDETINFSDIRAERVDLDYAEAVVRFQAAQSVFEASLRTTGRLIPLSLVDFI